MTIYTGFKPKDVIWFMWENKPQWRTIRNIIIAVWPDGDQMRVGIKYHVIISYAATNLDSDNVVEFSEDKVFGTKEELLNSL